MWGEIERREGVELELLQGVTGHRAVREETETGLGVRKPEPDMSL